MEPDAGSAVIRMDEQDLQNAIDKWEAQETGIATVFYVWFRIKVDGVWQTLSGLMESRRRRP